MPYLEIPAYRLLGQRLKVRVVDLSNLALGQETNQRLMVNQDQQPRASQGVVTRLFESPDNTHCLLYTSPSPRD